MAVVGIGGSGGAGFPAGNTGQYGYSKSQLLGPGITSGGGTGGKILLRGDDGDDGSAPGGNGANAGANGASGSIGATGYAILGYNNLTQIIATGNITGQTTNLLSYIPPVTNVSYVSANTSLLNTIGIPASTNSGDLLIFFDSAWNTNIFGGVPAAKNVPNGWTEICDVTYDTSFTNNMRSTVSYKIADANDAGVLLGGTQDASVRKMVMVFRTNEIINVATAFTLSNRAEHSGLSNTRIDLTAQTGALVAVAHFASDAPLTTQYTTVYNPMSNNITLGDIYAPNGQYQLVKFNVFNSTDTRANGTVGLNDTGGINILQTFFIRIT